MKYLIAILFSTCLVWSCLKQTTTHDPDLENDKLEIRNKENNITLCHLNDQGEYKVISVNPNAMQAHLNHGDYNPDADGDGYTTIGACTGSQDDCDDQDASIHPGSTFCTDCVCFDLVSVTNTNLLFYYNSENNPCGIYEEAEGVLLFYLDGADTLVLAAGIDEGGHLVGRSKVVNGIVIKPETNNCLVFVEAGDISLAQYENCLDGLRMIISTHPTMTNVCDLDNPPLLDDTNPPFQKESSIQ